MHAFPIVLGIFKDVFEINVQLNKQYERIKYSLQPQKSKILMLKIQFDQIWFS